MARHQPSPPSALRSQPSLSVSESYTILTSDDPETLAEKVNRLMQTSDFIPAGGVCFHGIGRYAQAMVIPRP